MMCLWFVCVLHDVCMVCLGFACCVYDLFKAFA